MSFSLSVLSLPVKDREKRQWQSNDISLSRLGFYAPLILSVFADNFAPLPPKALQGCWTTCSAAHQDLPALQSAQHQLVCQSLHREPQPPPCQTHASQPASMHFTWRHALTCCKYSKPMHALSAGNEYSNWACHFRGVNIAFYIVHNTEDAAHTALSPSKMSELAAVSPPFLSSTGVWLSAWW